MVLIAALCLFVSVGRTAEAQETRFISEYRLDRDTVDIPFEYKSHEIIVHGEADGKKDLTFVFDTGATSPVLDKALGLTGMHISDNIVQEAEGKTAAEAVWFDDLRIGDKDGSASVHNIAVLLTNLSQMSRLLGRKIDGVIGISFMAGFVVEIDYEKHILHFYSARNFTIADKKPDNQRTFLFDLAPANARPLSCMLIHGKLHPEYDYDFLLDTGFGGYVSVAQAAAQESGLFKPDTPRVPGTSYGVSRSFESNKIRAKYLMLGNINLSGRIISVDVRNNDAYGQTGIVGNRLLQNYLLILDYPRRKLWLERRTEKEEPDEAEKLSLGLSIRADGRTIRVERVGKNSPAEHAGVRPGDTILSINGRSLDTLTTVQALNLLASPQGATTLTLARRVDPNLGTRGESVTFILEPQCPLDWKAN
jgi:predicted aspartyl protease